MPKGSKPVEIKMEKAAPFILLSSVANKPGIGAKICASLAEHDINIESLHAFSVPGKEKVDILIELSEEYLAEASYFLGRLAKEIQMQGLLYPNIYIEELLTLVISGRDFAKSPGIAAKIFHIFSTCNINIWAFSGTRAGEMRIWVDKNTIDKSTDIFEYIKQELSKL